MFGYGRLKPAITPPNDDAAKNLRRRNRVNVVLLECELGQLLDLSLTGMRLRCKRKPLLGDKPFTIALRVSEHTEVLLHARAIWARRAGLTSHEVGLEFIDVTPAQMSAISRLARDCSDCEVVRPRAAS